MGQPMATNVAKFFDLAVVYDPYVPARERFLEKTKDFRIDPKTVCASSLDEFLERAFIRDSSSDSCDQKNVDVVICSLPTSKEVKTVAEAIPECKISRKMYGGVIHNSDKTGADAFSRPIIVDTSSGDIFMTREIGREILQPKNITMIDCPVSGGNAGAKAQTLTAMYGVDIDAALDVIDPVVASFAKNRSRAGDLGSAHAVKAINNTLLATNIISITEALLALKNIGIDPEAALAIINKALFIGCKTACVFPSRPRRNS